MLEASRSNFGYDFVIYIAAQAYYIKIRKECIKWNPLKDIVSHYYSVILNAEYVRNNSP